ncbi:MAG: SufE family protein [Pirellulales bacterium]|nr:SufE family protein [Pirellulales bacterium]
MTGSAALGDRLEQLCQEFAGLDVRDRLELLLEYAESLPPLPERFAALRQDESHRVPECQTPVYLFTELEDGRLRLHAEVAPEAPTVKGFVAVLRELVTGALPAEVATLDVDLLRRLGLVEALGMVRMRGLHAVFQRIRNEARRLAA